MVPSGGGLTSAFIHLVHVVFLNGAVEHGVEIVEEVDHLHWCTHRGQVGKADYIREVDGHTVIQLGTDSIAFLQFVSYNPEIHVHVVAIHCSRLKQKR